MGCDLRFGFSQNADNFKMEDFVMNGLIPRNTRFRYDNVYTKATLKKLLVTFLEDDYFEEVTIVQLS